MTRRGNQPKRRLNLAALLRESHSKQMLRPTHHGAEMFGSQRPDRKLELVGDPIGLQDFDERAKIGAVSYQAINGLEAALGPQLANAKNRTSNSCPTFGMHRRTSQLPPSSAKTRNHRTATVKLIEIGPYEKGEVSFVIFNYFKTALASFQEHGHRAIFSWESARSAARAFAARGGEGLSRTDGEGVDA